MGSPVQGKFLKKTSVGDAREISIARDEGGVALDTRGSESCPGEMELLYVPL